MFLTRTCFRLTDFRPNLKVGSPGPEFPARASGQREDRTMYRNKVRCGLAFVVGLAVVGLVGLRPADGQGAGEPIVFTLKKEFIEKYRNRVTIETDMQVDHAGNI